MKQKSHYTMFLLLFLALFTCASHAQVFHEKFNIPDGALIPGWTRKVGAWSVHDGRLTAEACRQWQYITADGFRTLNGMVQVTVLYNTASSLKLQFGGGALRFVHSGCCFMNKIQNNDSSTGFDRFYICDRPCSSRFVNTKPRRKAVIRLGALDRDLIGKVDHDLDGKWDSVLVKTSDRPLQCAGVGIAGYGGCAFDDFKYFDAIVRLDPEGLEPKPGNVITLELRGTRNLAYQCACSFTSSAGIRVGSRRIPLDPDDLMTFSFKLPMMFRKFSGVLDASGAGKARIHIHANPAFKGFGFHFAMVTLDPAARNGIRNISNDVRIDIR